MWTNSWIAWTAMERFLAELTELFHKEHPRQLGAIRGEELFNATMPLGSSKPATRSKEPYPILPHRKPERWRLTRSASGYPAT